MFDFLSKKFSFIFNKFTGQDKLTESNISDALLQVQDALLEADVPFDVVKEFSKQLQKEVVGQKVIGSLKPTEQLLKIVYDKILSFLGGYAGASGVTETQFAFSFPSVVMALGLQGSGKTTTLAKLANDVKEAALKRGKARRILLASVDYYRPAAIDQLEILAGRAGVDFYRSTANEPISASQDILKHFNAGRYDILFLDTAGRLHIDDSLMHELKEVNKIVKPKYKLLVLDAMTGQESLKVAQAFDGAVGITGAILSKMDSEARGGLAFAFKYILNKPILFIGTGEKITDLELFKPERIASRIVGMGDMMSLIEKAQEKIKESDQEQVYKSMTQGKMTLVDFASQMDMLSKLGSLSSLVKYLPGIGSLNVSQDQVEQGEKEMKKFRALINSMTMKERLMPKILDKSRKERIAKGSGLNVTDVDLLLERLEYNQQFAKVLKKMEKGKFF